ncbi:beta-N-acetylglucosaminidase domain-containing protein [Clostridium sp.]|uniref:beta-N-acetylglucosaminidase domain-containing protein n=1 Tax=Clostridium sp. TaxID=1506 RepID=UPI003F3D4A29
MRRKLFKKLSLCLAITFSIGLISNSNVIYAESEKEYIDSYEIYPIPQDIEYTGDHVTIPNEVNVIYNGIVDESTKAHLQNTLGLLDSKVVESKEVKEGEFNIVASLSTEEVGYTPKKEDLFNNYDANVIEITEDGIKLIGNDSDALYCAITTLQLMIEQSSDNTILKTVVEDYADIQYRGYIEGYYGIPWSNSEIISLMEFGSKTKLNTFIYAPKDDPYHNSKWREPYPQSELDKMAELIEAGVRTKNRFIYAIHPFMSNGINKENYQQEMQYIIDKFEILYDLGVRQFALLADDAASETALQVKAINTLTEWLDSKEGTYPLIFCPQAYSGGPSASYYNQFRDGTKITIGGKEEQVQAVKDDVEIMHTGPAIIGNVDDNLNQRFYDVSGRYPYMWLNWPVNDYTDSTLFIGKAEMLKKTDKLNGLVSNPMCEAELSKIGLFQVADYSWNVDDFNVDASWDASFKNTDSSVEEELRILARHMSYPRDGVYHQTGLAWEESEDLKEPIDALKAKLEANEDATIEAKDLKLKLEEILNAANSLMEKAENPGLKKEFAPYRQSLVATLEASIAGLNSIIAINQKDYDTAWNEYSNIATKIKESNSVTKPGYKPGGYTNLEVKPATKRLRPLANYLNGKLGKELNKILGLEGVDAKVYYNFAQWSNTPESEFNKYYDGDMSTYTKLEYGGIQQVGDYFGLDLGEVKDLVNVSITQGASDSDNDIFHYAVLEASKDGEVWTTIKDYSEESAPHNINVNTNTPARFVRLRLTKQGYNNKPDFWLHIREMSVVVNDGVKLVSNIENITGANLTDSKSNIELELKGTTLGKDNYVAVQLPKLELVTLTNIELPEGIAIEHSENFKVWNELENGEEIVTRYIKLTNNSDLEITLNTNLNIYVTAIEEPKVSVGADYGFGDANGPKKDNPSQKIFTVDGLKEGNHKITILTEASGVNNNQYKASVDKFVIKNGEEVSEVNLTTNTPGLTLGTGNSNQSWRMWSPKTGWLNNDEMYLVDTTGSIEYEFNGTGFELYGAFGPDMCKYNYFIDGVAYNNSLNNVFDGEEATKGHYKTKELTIDMGQKIGLNHIQVKVAEDVATENPQAVLGQGKVQVSADGREWVDVKNFNVQGNELTEDGFNGREVPYFWIDIDVEGNKDYRYIRLAYEEEKEFIVNEISVNNGEAILGSKIFEISTTEEITNANQVSNLIDKELETQFTMHATDKPGYLKYKLTDREQVSALTIIQNANTISNAKVEVLTNGNWKEVGKLDKSINLFDVSTFANVTEVKVSHESLKEDFQLIEITYSTDANLVPPVEIVIEKPSNLKYEELTSNSAVLKWNEPKAKDSLVGYVIYKDGKIIGETSDTTFNLTELKSNTIYGVKVVSKYSNGGVSKPVSLNIRTHK